MRFGPDGQCCDTCGGIKSQGIPDVFFNKPYLDPNLVNPRRPWDKEGVWIESKQHKKRLMDEQGLREAGDRKHGAINYDKHISRNSGASYRGA